MPNLIGTFLTQHFTLSCLTFFAIVSEYLPIAAGITIIATMIAAPVNNINLGFGICGTYKNRDPLAATVPRFLQSSSVHGEVLVRTHLLEVPIADQIGHHWLFHPTLFWAGHGFSGLTLSLYRC